MNTLFKGFKNKYPQEFLDELARITGTEWVKVEFKCVPKESVPIAPLPPPVGQFLYMDVVYKTLNK